MMRVRLILAVALACAAALTACNPPAVPPAPAASESPAAVATAEPVRPAEQPTAAPPPAVAAPSPTPAPPPTAVPAAPPAATGGEQKAPAAVQPGALKSYVVDIEVKVERTKPDRALETWSLARMRFRREPPPPASAITVTDKSGLLGGGDVSVVIAGDSTYLLATGGSGWIKLQAGSDEVETSGLTQTVINPDDLLAGAPKDLFTEANIVGRSEEIEGVAATHYRATGALLVRMLRAGGQTNFKLVSGRADFWIAEDGGYLKQYTSEATLQRGDVEETSTVRMLVTGENQPVTIEVPSGDVVVDVSVGGAAGDEASDEASDEEEAGEDAATREELAALPAPPLGREVQPGDLPGDLGEVINLLAIAAPVRVFISDAPPDEVDRFYREELARLGYQAFPGQPGELGVVLSFYARSDGERTLLLRVGLDTVTGKTLVIIEMM